MLRGFDDEREILVREIDGESGRDVAFQHFVGPRDLQLTVYGRRALYILVIRDPAAPS